MKLVRRFISEGQFIWRIILKSKHGDIQIVKGRKEPQDGSGQGFPDLRECS